ncbi:MAG TPA: cation:proton antiporter [Methylocella sp.]|nr:cation:proton antiporter [Methylocella sp.]
MTDFTPEDYKETLVFLTTAGVVVPFFRHLKVSPILGFLIAGVLLGPHGFGALSERSAVVEALTFSHIDRIAQIAAFGVVFVLFMIGLELSWQRLAIIGRLVFGLGALQVFGSAAILGALALFFGQPANSATVLGLALALSTTAIVIPVLAETKRLGTTAGRTIFAVLLFQDLMVAPLLFLVTMLSQSGNSLGMVIVTTLVPALTGLSILILGGRLVLRPLFRLVASTGSTEFFMAACLLVVIGTGVVTAMSGLSMGLGAFIAGLLLAETEYRREIEVTIEPFKGLLLGLFFVSTGASLDLSRIFMDPIRTFSLAIAIIVVKFIVGWIAGWVLRLPARVSTEVALLLAPGGEFTFVIVTAAVTANVVPADSGADVMIAVTLSMFTVPLMAFIARRLIHPSVSPAPAELSPPEEADFEPDAIIVGYGRVGQLVGDMLNVHRIRFLAIDTDPLTVRRLRTEGHRVYWGNATRLGFLARCGLGKAKALIITMNKPADAEAVVEAVRINHPELTIVARARDAHHATLLYRLGVSDAVPETIEASLQLSEAVLVDMGVPMGKVIASIHEKRDEFRKLLQPVTSRGKALHSLKMAASHERARETRRGK